MGIYFKVIAAAFIGLMGITTPAKADFDEARRYYEALSADDRTAITLGLIATGDFVSLHQLGFNQRYFSSIVSFEKREGLLADGMLTSGERSILEKRTSKFLGEMGLKDYTHPLANSKLWIPRSLFDRETRSEEGYDFVRNDRNLALSFVAYPGQQSKFNDLYLSLTEETAERIITYKRMREDYFVVTGEFQGARFYTWMSSVPSGITGFTLAWSTYWRTTGSKLSILLANAFEPVSSGNRPAAEPPPVSPPDQNAATPVPAEPGSGSGSGFRVTEAGHIVTNFHVAGNCKSIALRRPGDLPVPAELVAGDKTNDLAIIKSLRPLAGSVANLAQRPPKVGTEIAVFGYPLVNLLADSGNFVTGNVTSLAGIGNDSRLLQISAPVQPGNSGGPVVDSSGAVVAVVVSKLDALAAIQSTGDIPQNVNFAIKSNVAMNFMDGNGIGYKIQSEGSRLELPQLADVARDFTYLIECQN